MLPVPGRPSTSIVAAAVFLLLLSLAVFFWSVWSLQAVFHRAGNFHQVLLYAQAPSIAIFDVATLVQLVFGVLGAAIALALFRLRERARTAIIFFSIFAVAGNVFVLLLFIGETHANGRESLNAGFGVLLYGAFLLVLVPLAVWWIALFTRPKIASQFQPLE